MNRRPLATTFAGLMVAYGDLGKRPSRPDVWMSVRTDRFGTALRNGDARGCIATAAQCCDVRHSIAYPGGTESAGGQCWYPTGGLWIGLQRCCERGAMPAACPRPSWRALCTFIATWWPRSSGAVAGQAMILSSASSGRWRPMVTCRDCGQRWESEPARHLLFAAHERLTRRLESHGVGAQRTPGRFPSPYEPP